MLPLAIRLCVVGMVCVWTCSPQHCRAQTPDSVLNHVLILGRAQLAEALRTRESDLPENRLGRGCVFWTSDLLAHRAKSIAKVRVEITVSRWIAILRLEKARSTFRAVSQPENNLDRDGFLSAATKSLRRSIRCSLYAELGSGLQWIAEHPVLANQPSLDFMRCYLIASALITLDAGLIKELDEMLVAQVKMILEIERFTRWETRIRRECAMLKTAISVVDLAFVLTNLRLSD